MLNSALITRNVTRLLRRRPVDLSEFITERHEIVPAEESPGQPALYPEGALDRITALSPWRDWESERELIEGAPGRHLPTEAHVVRQAVIAGAYLYRGGAKERIGRGEARMLDPDLPPCRTYDEAHLVSSWTGADFFGHFMQDSLPLEMLPSDAAPRLGAPGRPYLHEEGYRALLGLPRPEMPGHARIERLTLYRDVSQNSFKARRYRVLRARLRDGFPETTPPPGIFLRRGKGGEARQLVNEEAVVELLSGLGFDIVDPETTSAAEIVRRALAARIVVAVEGSHLGHALYTLADDGAFLVIQPPDRFALPYKEVADCLGMRFGFVVGVPAQGGFTADLQEIRLMLERLT